MTNFNDMTITQIKEALDLLEHATTFQFGKVHVISGKDYGRWLVRYSPGPTYFMDPFTGNWQYSRSADMERMQFENLDTAVRFAKRVHSFPC